MKCKVIRIDLKVAPIAYDKLGKAAVESMSNVPPGGSRVWNEGAVINDPQAYMLVRQGCAVPEDDECRKRAGMSANQMENSQSAYQAMKDRIDDERAEENDPEYDEDDDE